MRQDFEARFQALLRVIQTGLMQDFLKVQTQHCFFKNGPIPPASFCLFLSFSHYYFNNTNLNKRRWCAWDLNPRPHDGRRDRGAMAAAIVRP